MKEKKNKAKNIKLSQVTAQNLKRSASEDLN